MCRHACPHHRCSNEECVHAGSPLGVMEEDPQTKQAVLNTAVKGGRSVRTPMPTAASAAATTTIATVLIKKAGETPVFSGPQQPCPVARDIQSKVGTSKIGAGVLMPAQSAYRHGKQLLAACCALIPISADNSMQCMVYSNPNGCITKIQDLPGACWALCDSASWPRHWLEARQGFSSRLCIGDCSTG